MHDLKGIILQHAISMWRRRWHAIGVAWLVCVVGWTAVAYMPNIYEAKTRVYVDTDSMLRPLLRGLAVDNNMLNEVDLMQRTLLSRPNLQKVARLADLDLNAKTVAEQENVVSELERRVRINRQAQNLFLITYHGGKPETARNVVQALLTVFVESNLGESRKDIASARTFIDDQIVDYKGQLETAERFVADFKARHIGGLPGESVAKIEQQFEISMAERSRTQGELNEAKRRRDEFQRQMATVPQYADVVNTGRGGELEGDASLRAASLEQKLRVLRMRYTDTHPDVQDTKRLLELAQSEATQSAGVEGGGASNRGKIAGRNANPVFERMRAQMGEEEARIAALESRLERNNVDVTRWEDRVKSIPTVGAELARLTRDYDVIKRNYEEMITRRESAKLGQKLEAQSKTLQFRIVDPPEVPAVPAGPNRVLFVSVIFAVGLAAGLFFSFFMGQIDNSIVHLAQLRAVANLPVLGSISTMITAAESWRRKVEAATYSVVCIALVGAFVGLLSVELLLTRGGA